MTIVHIEHPTVGFDAWKAAFDRDPIGRKRVGVRHYRIVRDVEERNHVAIDLVFEDRPAAERFRASMLQLWQTPQAGAVLAGAPSARIVEEVETGTY